MFDRINRSECTNGALIGTCPQRWGGRTFGTSPPLVDLLVKRPSFSYLGWATPKLEFSSPLEDNGVLEGSKAARKKMRAAQPALE